jgi:hypothetical protein
VREHEAVDAFRARWEHPPLDPHDVEERIAIRRRDAEPASFVVHRTPPPEQACRIFLQLAEAGGTKGRPLWSSRYAHSTGEVDRILDALEAAKAIGALETTRARNPL